MRVFAKVAFGFFATLYPISAFICLVVLKLPLKFFSLFVVVLGAAYFFAATGGGFKKNARLIFSALALSILGGTCIFTGREEFIKLYPVLMNGAFLFAFGSSLFFPPNACFRLACLSDKTIKGSVSEKKVERYCKRVTVVWCAFFVLNGTAAFYTVLFASSKLWSLYNGGISYALMGALFAIEFLMRRATQKKMPKSIPISAFCADSRADNTILCFDGEWSEKKYLFWRDFLRDSAKIRAFIEQFPDVDSWILHVEDYWLFLCALVALLQKKKEILLTANISPRFIEEIKAGEGKKEIRFLTDCKEIEGKPILNADFLPDVISKITISEEEMRTTPQIDAASTRIVLYTSGSTGKPKAVQQRMTEFEADNAFVIKKWGEEFLSRRLVSTVSQHHIYGFLFTICLPFTLAVPFRKKRIEFPEEFRTLTDEQYVIIAVPAFLKRTCASLLEKLPLKNPWIFTSGGAVSEKLALETQKTFGFCPLEVYGSTETSGIAYRQQSVDGLQWTPFDNAKIWLDENDGCLTIISPYIKDERGFKTGDLADIQADGRFFLKGRADSIVKIEEKRISLPEVENRFLQTGLVSDCAVVALSGKRQYLAAAIVLNESGREKFRDTPKFLVNRHFHDYLLQFFENVVLPKRFRYVEKIPQDVQGKKHKDEIKSLFDALDGEGEKQFLEESEIFSAFLLKHGISCPKNVSRSDFSVDFELLFPKNADYFDGHFPSFPILPAVAQFDVVSHAVAAFLGAGKSATKIRRLKFSGKILPDSIVRFSISLDSEKNRISFKISSEAGETLSSGSYDFGES